MSFSDYLKKRKEKKRLQKERYNNMSSMEKLFSSIKTILGAVVVVMIINGLLVASFVVPTGSMENEVMTGDFLFVNKFVYGPTTPQVIPFINQELPFIKFPGIKDPEKSDVIVFIYPGRMGLVEPQLFQYYLKRCMATAGDTIQVIDEVVYVNGIKQPIPDNVNFDPTKNPARPASFPLGANWTHSNYGPLVIPQEGDVIPITRENIEKWRIFIMREGHDVTFDSKSVYIDDKPATEYIVERDYCFGMGDNRRNSEDSRDWGFIPYENVTGTPLIVYWSWDTNMPFGDFFDKLSTIKFGRIGNLID